jgi:hypothetical protein
VACFWRQSRCDGRRPIARFDAAKAADRPHACLTVFRDNAPRGFALSRSALDAMWISIKATFWNLPAMIVWSALIVGLTALCLPRLLSG